MAAVLMLTFGLPVIGGAQDFSMVKSLDEYVRAAKANQPPLQTSQGSLYSANGLMSDLFTDSKARRVNDIVTVSIIESTQATSAADATIKKSSATDLGAPNLLGLEKLIPNFPLSKLLSTSSDQQFTGNGSTNRSGSVTALLSSRVREVLPNGDLVIEGVKEIKVNNERQMLRLFGVVRPRDVGQDNIVLSTSVANMLVQVDGKGVISDGIKHGWLFGILSKTWPF
jgi:flagellar L-ring protein precursor FlgH